MKQILYQDGKFIVGFKDRQMIGKLFDAHLLNPKKQQIETDLKKQVERLRSEGKVFLEKSFENKDNEELKQEYFAKFDEIQKQLAQIKGPIKNKSDVKTVRCRITKELINEGKYDGIIYQIDILKMPKNFTTEVSTD
jgi:hypothetical protein